MQLDSGAVAEGRITRVTDFGAFIQFENGETGLVHISQIAHSFVRNIHDHVREGDTVEVKVLGRDERGRLDLSIKELLEEPEEVPRPRSSRRNCAPSCVTPRSAPPPAAARNLPASARSKRAPPRPGPLGRAFPFAQRAVCKDFRCAALTVA